MLGLQTFIVNLILILKGVRGFVSAKDVPGSNTISLTHDENIFADDEVTAVGQIIGIVVAEDRLTAQRGAKTVRVTYNKLPTVLTIEVMEVYYCTSL